MLDPGVQLALATPPQSEKPASDSQNIPHLAEGRSKQLGRDVVMLRVNGDMGPDVVRLAKDGDYDLIVLAPPADPPSGGPLPLTSWMEFVIRNAHCRVFVAATVAVPQTAAE